MHLSRSASCQCGVRSIVVVPGRVAGQFAAHCGQPMRNEHPSRALGLHRADEALEDRDAAVHSNGAKPRSDVSPPAPSLEAAAKELLALVRDDGFRGRACLLDRPIQERTDLGRIRTPLEEREADDEPGRVVQSDGHPPAEGPALDLGKGG